MYTTDELSDNIGGSRLEQNLCRQCLYAPLNPNIGLEYGLGHSHIFFWLLIEIIEILA